MDTVRCQADALRGAALNLRIGKSRVTASLRGSDMLINAHTGLFIVSSKGTKARNRVQQGERRTSIPARHDTRSQDANELPVAGETPFWRLRELAERLHDIQHESTHLPPTEDGR